MATCQPSQFEAARRGDREALAELFRSYQAPVLRYLRARRIAAPEDVASEVWVNVARSIAQFDGDDDDFRRWLFTIAHHRSVDAVRRAVRRNETSLDAGDATEAGRITAGADDEHERNGALARAIDMLASLPDNMAEAVMLRVVNDLSMAEVAMTMGTTEGNVRVLVHRGVDRLRRKMSVTEPIDPTMTLVS